MTERISRPLRSKLAEPVQLGALTLRNRVVMAPLTRMRADADRVPTSLHATYYSQRSSAGLLIAEATQISAQGTGYPGTPGIYTERQIAGWRAVTDAVHAAGGQIVLQLWHVGRISHSSHQPDNGPPVAPSAVRPAGGTFSATWAEVAYETPRALALHEIPAVVADFRRGAENAKVAGFDGVEVHAANGYLLDQFLQDRTNRRVDAYGGSFANRTRLLLEVIEAVGEVWSPARVGVRLSPFGRFNDIGDSDPIGLFRHVVAALNTRGLGYLHLIEPRATNAMTMDALEAAPGSAELFREAFRGGLISAGGYTPDEAERAVAAGVADAIAFGRAFIANPDLAARVIGGAPLNPAQRATFYGGGAEGYTDYPTLEGEIAS